MCGDSNRTALDAAAEHQWAEIASLLLEAGTRRGTKRGVSWRFLQAAERHRHDRKVLKRVVRKGFELKLKSSAVERILEFAVFFPQ